MLYLDKFGRAYYAIAIPQNIKLEIPDIPNPSAIK